MSDEQRIRDYCRTSPHLHPEVHDMLLGAADEIERLERENATLRLAFFQLADFAAQQRASVTQRICSDDVPADRTRGFRCPHGVSPLNICTKCD